MCAETYKTGEPYKLLGHRMVFTNWNYVRPTRFCWCDTDGEPAGIAGSQGPEEADIKYYDRAWGVRLASRPAVRSGPVFKVERPWEAGGASVNTIIREGNIYRAWGNTGWGDLKTRSRKYFCYFESRDGMNWERPDCGIVEYNGNCNNNLLAEKGGTVFIDPSAPGSARYKWIADAPDVTREEYEEYRRRRPGEIDFRAIRSEGRFFGVRGAVSPDGLHWKQIPQILVMMHADTQNVVYYDTVLKKYVAYFRDWMAGPQAEDNVDKKGIHWNFCARRAVGRSETDDFSNFPLSGVILETRPDWPPDNVLYTNCRTTIPGAPDHHLMFPAIWDTVNDTTHIKLVSSHDGRIWNYVPGGPVLKTADFGQWDGGCVFASPNLIELPNGDFALPYNGFNVPHKYPRVKAARACGYALWPKGRLAALEAVERGEFSTVAVVPPGGKLLINAVTRRAGRILIEACDLAGNPIPGREFDNAIPVAGDQYKTPVTWKGHDNLGIEPGQAVILRFKMDQADIYSLEFEK